MKEKIKNQIKDLTEEETEKLIESLKGIFRNITIANPDRIPKAFEKLGQAYDELGI